MTITPTDPRHGQRAGYVAGCRCAPCSTANRRYAKQYRARREQTGQPVRVNTTDAAAHITKLRADGMSLSDIAHAAGIALHTVSALTRGLTAATHPRVVAALLRVTSDIQGRYERQTLVPAEPTARRLRALAALGHTWEAVGHHSGCSGRALQLIANGHTTTVLSSTARAIATTYDQMSMTLPVGTTRNHRGGITRARNLARGRGWLPPLAWDEGTLDDLDATPANEYRPGRRRVDLDEYMWLIEAGEDPSRAAARMGVTIAGIEKRAKNEDRPDVLGVVRGVRWAERPEKAS